MKQYIEREAVKNLMERALEDDWEIQYANDRLSDIPAADVVEVVRCRDCKHRPYLNPNAPFGPTNEADDDECPYYCDDSYYTKIPAYNGFCDRGERKGGDE